MQLSPLNRKGQTQHKVKPGLKPSLRGWRAVTGTLSPTQRDVPFGTRLWELRAHQTRSFPAEK